MAHIAELIPGPQGLLTLLTIIVFLYCISLVIYRLFLCPVAHIPGPPLAKATYWYG